MNERVNVEPATALAINAFVDQLQEADLPPIQHGFGFFRSGTEPLLLRSLRTGVRRTTHARLPCAQDP